MYGKILALQELFKEHPEVASISFGRYYSHGNEPEVLLQGYAFFDMLDPMRTLEQNGVWIVHADHCNATFLYLKRGGVVYNTCFHQAGLSMDDLEVLRYAE